MLHPFIVSTGGTSIRVTGTKFNVKSYDDDKDVHTALMEGKVIVEYADSLGRGREIFQGQQMQLSILQVELT